MGNVFKFVTIQPLYCVGRPVKLRAHMSKLRICDPYAEMIHGSCFGKSIFDDERHWQ